MCEYDNRLEAIEATFVTHYYNVKRKKSVKSVMNNSSQPQSSIFGQCAQRDLDTFLASFMIEHIRHFKKNP